MGFTPKPRDEIDDMKLIEKGTYDFEVVKSEEGTSSGGNQMTTVDLKVFRDDGSFVFVRDWLMDMDNYYAQHKCRGFCETTGATEINGHMQGLAGLVSVVIEETEEWGKQNKVVGYPTERPDKSERAEKPEAVGTTGTSSLPPDDEIPF